MKIDIKKNIIKEYHNIIKFLIENNMVMDNLEFKENGNALTWSGKDAGIANIVYDNNIGADKIINTLRKEKQYNILLKDKSIFQIEYMIENNNIVKQRMLFMKVSNEVLNEIDEENTNFDEDIKTTDIPLLIRVDYDIKNQQDVKHPASHMTISNIKNCRIPIKSNMPFSKFIKFILMNVYGIDYRCEDSITDDETITENEKKCIHINWLN